jgi:hypothetical protein
MPLNLPLEVWVMLFGAGVLFLSPLVVVYLAYRGLRKRSE